MFIFNEFTGIIKIHIIVRVAAGKTPDVIEATHTNYPVHKLWVTEGKIDGMVSSEACAGAD